MPDRRGKAIGLLLLFLSAWLATISPAQAQQATTAPLDSALANTVASPPDPAKLHQLAGLLNDPSIRAWLAAGSPVNIVPAGGISRPVPDRRPMMASAMPMMSMPGNGVAEAVVTNVEMTRAFLHDLTLVVPKAPAELHKGWQVLSIDLEAQGLHSVLFALVVFVALGFGCEKLFWWASSGFRQRMIATRLTSPRDRFRAAAYRLVYGLGVVLAFAVGSIGAFLLLDWQPLLQYIVLAYLQVVLVIRIVLVLGRFLLAPGAERFRLLPMTTAAARFWFIWSAVITGWFFFVQHSLRILNELGVARDVIVLLGLPCGLVLLGFAIYTVWASPDADEPRLVKRSHRIGPWALSIYLVGVWLMLFSGSTKPFYIGVVLLLMSMAIRGTNRMAANMLRPELPTGDEATDGEAADNQVSPLVAVSLERGVRAALLIGGAWIIASLLEIDLAALTIRDTLPMRLLRGVINASIVVLLADFVWHLLRSWIDQQVLIAAERSGDGGKLEKSLHLYPCEQPLGWLVSARKARRGAL